MRNRGVKIVGFLLLIGGVAAVVWQRLKPAESPAPAPDPFMRPTPEPSEQAAAEPASTTVGEEVEPLPTPPHGPFTTAPEGPADDLKRITGVGPKLEQMLNEQGITTFRQLAALTDEQVDELQSRLPQFPGRIRRDNWVEQAKQLSTGDTA